jgi:hypothetical protein
MLTREDLEQRGLNYKQFRWRWLRPHYKLQTAEFSGDGTLLHTNYEDYLRNWAMRLNEEISPYDPDQERYVVIERMYHEHKYITLVEIEEEE